MSESPLLNAFILNDFHPLWAIITAAISAPPSCLIPIPALSFFSHSRMGLDHWRDTKRAAGRTIILASLTMMVYRRADWNLLLSFKNSLF